MKLRSKIVISSTLLVALPVLLIGILSGFTSRRIVSEQNIKTAAEQLRLRAALLNARVDAVSSFRVAIESDVDLKELLQEVSYGERERLLAERTFLNKIFPRLFGMKTGRVLSVVIFGDDGLNLASQTVLRFVQDTQLLPLDSLYTILDGREQYWLTHTDTAVFSVLSEMDESEAALYWMFRIREPLQRDTSGVVVIGISPSLFDDICVQNAEGSTVLLNEEGVLLAGASASEIQLGAKKLVTLTERLSSTGMFLQTSLYPMSLYRPADYILLVSFFFAGFAGLFAWLGAVRISNSISGFLHAVQGTLHKVTHGQRSFSFESVTKQGAREVARTDEYRQLIDTLNTMIEDLGQAEKRIQEDAVSLGRLEAVALRNQISPHFLYNTLDSLYWMARDGNNEEVAATVLALARLFRHSLDSNELVPLTSEIAHASDYLTVQNIRLKGAFSLDVAVDEACEEVLVPRLFLQPLIENALRHGFAGKNHGQISIRAQVRDKRLNIAVLDTGDGIDAAAVYLLVLGSNEPEQASALRNIYRRLFLFFNTDVQFRVSRVARTTEIFFSIPLLRAEEREHV